MLGLEERPCHGNKATLALFETGTVGLVSNNSAALGSKVHFREDDDSLFRNSANCLAKSKNKTRYYYLS